MTSSLKSSALSDLATKDNVLVPQYDRSNVSVGIVHFGVGNFHRAHQALYTDKVLANADQAGWGICGVGLRKWDEEMRRVTAAQDCLYSLLECGPTIAQPKLRIIGSHIKYLYAPENPTAVLEMLCGKGLKVVTLTVTEKGYCLDLSKGGVLDTSLEDVQHDTAELKSLSQALSSGVAGGKIPQLSKSFLTAGGFLAATILVRHKLDLGGFGILSCDNIQSNGDRCRDMVWGFLHQVVSDEHNVVQWTKSNVTFPNSMVDRITPATTDALRTHVAETFQISDAWPVKCEDFIQWVVEDHFPSGRPKWELDPTCLFVPDVLPYEKLKLRLLNGSHQALAYPACVLGHRVVHESLQADTIVRKFLENYMQVIRTAVEPTPPGINSLEYAHTLIARFTNTAVQDQVLRLTEDGANRLHVAVFPCVSLVPTASARVIWAVYACWLKYLVGHPTKDADAVASGSRLRTDDNNNPYTLSPDLGVSAGAIQTLSTAFVAPQGGDAHTKAIAEFFDDVFGEDVGFDVECVGALVAHIAQHGTESMLQDVVRASSPLDKL